MLYKSLPASTMCWPLNKNLTRHQDLPVLPIQQPCRVNHNGSGFRLRNLSLRTNYECKQQDHYGGCA